MSKSLVIVESPAKARTINRYLGSNYVVKSSVGHIRDLPKSGGGTKDKKLATAKKKKAPKKSVAEKLFDRMGIYPNDGWRAIYQVLPGKEKVLDELKKISADADRIYLATDLDREGEAIAWHLREALGGDDDKFKRVTFTEITKNAIQKAFEDPAELNMDMVNSQQTRRFLDRVVGYMLSPLLWAKVARGLSAGRVQSVAVRLIAEREREIHAFQPEEYWEVAADLDVKSHDLGAQVTKHKGKAFRPTSKELCDGALAELRQADYQLSQREDKPTRSKPSAPYITSTLQQASSVRLSYGVKKTMMLAQQLYEAGFITYMRTDSTNLSAEAVDTCRGYIAKKFGDQYLPKEPLKYSSKKGAQEAHEAIRPTDIMASAEHIKDKLSQDHARLYQIIWNQFVACQMVPAEFLSTSLVFSAGDYELRTRGRILKFDGYLRVQPAIARGANEDTALPDVKPGDAVALKELKPSQHFTKPPARFTEASLVKELEKKGIGRPSTYASIITTIQDRGYVHNERRRFYCLKMGDIVTDRLVENFDELMDYGFTAKMEENLDKVAQGDLNWIEVLNTFYEDFVAKVDKAGESMRGNEPTLTDIPCPLCDRPMCIRTARTGVFLSCSGYALPPKERCKGTLNLLPGEEAVAVANTADEEEGASASLEEIQGKLRCPKCGTAMDPYLIDEDRKIHVCGNNPDCDGFILEKGKFKIKGYDGPVIMCDKCDAEMHLKTGRFGKYFGCVKAPECKNTRKLLKNGEAAPPRVDPIPMPELACEQSDGHFILRDGASGIFLASSNFPRSRETRKPKVEDLVRHKDELDQKYRFLADAPVTDPDGNPAVIRFSRKTTSHYVMSEIGDKATGWSAFYEDGKWVEQAKPATKKKTTKAKAAKKKTTKTKATKTTKAKATKVKKKAAKKA